MFKHISLGVSDLVSAIKFYDKVLATLEYSRLFGSEEEEFMAYGPSESFFIICTPLEPERESIRGGNGSHICFSAPTKSSVDNFYERAMENGAECGGKPGIRKEYSPSYYAAYIYDLDGHKIEAVFSNEKD
jgi:catechol 2,3-dioxygenase-like lactoylglutathione lyase family enzyme